MNKERASCWSVTINNPTQSDEYNISQCRQRGWKVEGQLERGENGTLHYQLMLRTPQVRFSAIKSALPRAHIEVARNPQLLKQYVQKSDTRVAGLQVDQSLYPTQLQLFDWFASYYKQVKREWPNKTNLDIWDLMCRQKIQQGYMIGAEVMNPQIRAFIRRFGEAIVIRAENLKNDTKSRQTDRQANLFSQEVIIPEHADQEENASIQEETDDETSSGNEDEEEN